MFDYRLTDNISMIDDDLGLFLDTLGQKTTRILIVPVKILRAIDSINKKCSSSKKQINIYNI